MAEQLTRNEQVRSSILLSGSKVRRALCSLRDLPMPATVDIDVTPARDPDNLERLAAAFDELEAGLLTADRG